MDFQVLNTNAQLINMYVNIWAYFKGIDLN